jgi:hypothetical protein
MKIRFLLSFLASFTPCVNYIQQDENYPSRKTNKNHFLGSNISKDARAVRPYIFALKLAVILLILFILSFFNQILQERKQYFVRAEVRNHAGFESFHDGISD